MQTYQWNARNELIRVQTGGVDVATFTYDGFGRRATKTAGGVTTTYVYDAEDIVEERRSTGDVVRYVHGPGIDQVLARTTNGTDPVYYLTDHLGSVVQEVDATEAVVLERAYDPWGVPVQGGATSGYAFTGREWDAEIGLAYYRARYYQAGTGQFLSEDPIGLLGAMNFYSYVGGKPTGLVDPLGLCPDPDTIWDQFLRFTESLNRNIVLPSDLRVSEAGVPGPRNLGAKSLAQLAKHLKNLESAKQQLAALEARLAEVVGPKAKQPIQEAIKALAKDIKGHLKEIAQKWPDHTVK